MATVVLEGWRVGAQKVALTKCIRECTGMGLADAKHAVDALMKGDEVVLSVNDDVDLAAMAQRFEALGAVVKRVA